MQRFWFLEQCSGCPGWEAGVPMGLRSRHANVPLQCRTIFSCHQGKVHLSFCPMTWLSEVCNQQQLYVFRYIWYIFCRMTLTKCHILPAFCALLMVYVLISYVNNNMNPLGYTILFSSGDPPWIGKQSLQADGSCKTKQRYKITFFFVPVR